MLGLAGAYQEEAPFRHLCGTAHPPTDLLVQQAMSWCQKRCPATLSQANNEEGLQTPSVRNIGVHALGAVRLVLMIWATGNRAVGSVIADMMSTTVHRFTVPVLHIEVSHGCDLQKLLTTSSYMTFPMRRPFEARVAHQERGSQRRLV